MGGARVHRPAAEPGARAAPQERRPVAGREPGRPRLRHRRAQAPAAGGPLLRRHGALRRREHGAAPRARRGEAGPRRGEERGPPRRALPADQPDGLLRAQARPVPRAELFLQRGPTRGRLRRQGPAPAHLRAAPRRLGPGVARHGGAPRGRRAPRRVPRGPVDVARRAARQGAVRGPAPRRRAAAAAPPRGPRARLDRRVVERRRRRRRRRRPPAPQAQGPRGPPAEGPVARRAAKGAKIPTSKGSCLSRSFPTRFG